jgi:hypothetical protein
MFRRCGSLDVSHPYEPSRPVRGIVLPFFLPFTYEKTDVLTAVIMKILSLGMSHHYSLVRHSMELTASIFRIEEEAGKEACSLLVLLLFTRFP